jgi:hypothetical protein
MWTTQNENQLKRYRRQSAILLMAQMYAKEHSSKKKQNELMLERKNINKKIELLIRLRDKHSK